MKCGIECISYCTATGDYSPVQVTCGGGLERQSTDIASQPLNGGKVCVTNRVVVCNTQACPAVPKVGPDQTVCPGAVVTLDGSASTGVTAGMTYEWVPTQDPNRSTVWPTLYGVNPTLTVPYGGLNVGQSTWVSYELKLSGAVVHASTRINIAMLASCPRPVDCRRSSDQTRRARHRRRARAWR